MGVIYVSATLRKVGTVQGGFTSEFLVDTGSTDCVAPASEMRKIGLEPRGTVKYELADGTMRDLAFALAEVEVMGRITSGRVVFGPEGAVPLVGVTALESIGLAIDPAKQTLKLLPAVRL